MVSGSSLSASQAYSSVTVSPWKVRGAGIFLASGGSIVMRAQSNDVLARSFRRERGIHDLWVPVGGALGPPPGGLVGARTANLASGKLDADGKGAFRDGVVTGSRGRPSAARAGAAAGARPAYHRRDLHGADDRAGRGGNRQGPAR